MRTAIVRIGSVLTLFLISASSMNGVESPPTHNGYWWLRLNGAEKIMFVQGYVEGLSRADKLISMYLSVETLKIHEGANQEKIIDVFNFYRITYGQFVDGLDAFYADFKNKRILFNYAVLYVRDEIRGVSKKELDDRIEGMRQGTMQDNYDKQ